MEAKRGPDDSCQVIRRVSGGCQARVKHDCSGCVIIDIEEGEIPPNTQKEES